ncbi:MAG: GAF domain-containing protein [Anaerolineales bacterium]|nr:GAF domain-containing protein [Anaerolineales bacterium]
MTTQLLDPLTQTVADLSAAANLPALLQQLAGQAARLLAAPYAAVYQPSPGGPEALVCAAEAGECAGHPEWRPAARQAAVWAGTTPAERPNGSGGGPRRTAAALRWRGAAQGALVAVEAQAADAQARADLLAALAGARAEALAAAEAESAAQQQLTHLTILHDIALATVAAGSLDEVLARATQVLHARLPYDTLGVALLDPSGQHYFPHPSYVRGRQAGAWPQALPITQGLVGLALRQDRVVRVGVVRGHPDYWAGEPDVQSELVVPLRVGKHLMGALDAESYAANAFTDADEALLTGVVRLLAALIENAQLRDQAERQAHDLDQLARVQQAASASLDLHPVLTAIVTHMGQALEVSSAYVVELAGEVATVVAEYYSPAAAPLERLSDLYVTYPVTQFPMALHAFTTGKPIVIALSNAAIPAAEREHLLAYGAQATLVVPLMRQGRALGYVELWESRHDRRFSEAEINLAQVLATSAASALENARLYTAARRHGEQMRLVNEIGRDIAGILDADALVAQVCHRLEGAFGYYRAQLGLIAGSEIVFGARLDERRGRVYPERRFPLDGLGVVEWVAREAQPRHVPVTAADPPLPAGTAPAALSEVVVPLVAHGRTLGVLAVQVNQMSRAVPDEVATLEAISGQIAVALDNARLFDEARQRAAEVTALLTTTLAVTSTLELRPRLEAIILHARDLVGGDSATVYQFNADRSTLIPIVALDELYAEETLADRVVVGEGLVGYVAQTGVGQVFNRADQHPRAKVIPGTPVTPECLMVVPLKLGDSLTGVVAVYREGEREFTPHDFDLLSSFAAQAAVAIETAELYERLRDRAERLQATYNELAEMDHLKDEMVQNISHELRTPLTFLKSYVDLLLSGDLGPLLPEQQRSLSVVRDKTDLLVRLVSDIITLQAVTPATIARAPLDLARLGAAAIAGMAALAQEAGVTVETALPANPVLVRGDALRLSQVFDNLLGNALKFTPAAGTIRLVMRLEGEGVRVEVSDTGIGIPPAVKERVFDRFYQVDGSARRRRGGIGLGLAICKLIVEVHGGRIGVESVEGVGSTFYFVLPVTDQP